MRIEGRRNIGGGAREEDRGGGRGGGKDLGTMLSPCDFLVPNPYR
jgi:hypothetical protein